MTPRRRRPKRRNLTGVDIVAIILATGLSLLVILILIATIIQILHNAPGVPEIQLSENSTQILIAAIGGILGVLGGYIGYRMKEHHMTEEQTIPEANPSNPPTRPTVSPPEPNPGPGTPAPDTTPPEGDPGENDDKTDVQPRPEPKEGEEGDPHGSPLDDPDDERFVRRDPEEPAA
jgi:hypothetical protein